MRQRVFYHVRGPFRKLPGEAAINSQEANRGAGHAPAADRVQQIFFDEHGPRPVWRLLLYLCLVCAAYIALSALTYSISLGELRLQFVQEVQGVIAVLLPALLIARLEQRPFGDYGLPRSLAFGKLFWFGGMWGIGALSLLMLVLRGAGAYQFDGLFEHGWRIAKFAAYWAAFFLLVSFFEDFLTRGYTQFVLAGSVGFWPAAVLLSIGFGAIHLGNPHETLMGAVATACIGFFFCFTLRRTGSLWFAIGFHTAWDWGESFLYSVPDSGTLARGHLLRASFAGPAWLSGGAVGPEGSVLVFFLLAVLWLAFGRIYRDVKYVSAANETR